ncbi:F-box protein [Hordeum vulgare]|nr:F-box protein [Hordeum vulgare]
MRVALLALATLADGRAHACLAVLLLLRARHARYGKDRRVQRLAASARKDARAPAMAMLHMRVPEAPGRGPNYLDGIPDDLVLSIFSKLAASGTSPSDLLSVYLTCKRLNGLGQQDMVFAKASPASLAAWSEPVQRFLKRCADAGNLEACYILGMIHFYCLGSRSGGAALLAKAAVGGHPAALYSLAVIQFKGRGVPSLTATCAPVLPCGRWLRALGGGRHVWRLSARRHTATCAMFEV